MRHEALEKANEFERDQMGYTDFKKGFFELTNSGAYQAIEISDDWPDKITDESLRT